jgi:hypothetical protein
MAIFGLDTGQGPAMETAASMTPVGPVAPARRPVAAPRPPAPAPAAAPTGQPVMIDIETVQPGASPADLAAASRAVNIEAATGAQGKPMPTYASEAANRATAVSRFLEGQLRNLEQPSRFGSIASALAQRMIAPGKTFSQHLTDIEGAPIDRAYKIATAMAGLGKQSDQLTPAQLLRFTMDAAGKGQKNAQLTLGAADRFAAAYDDPTAAREAYLSVAYEAQQRNPNAGPEILTNPATVAAARARMDSSGVGMKQTGRVAKAEAATPGATGGGPEFDAEGNLVRFTPWSGEKLTRDEQAANTHFKTFGATSMPGFFKMQEERAKGAAAKADVTKVQKMKESILETNSVLRLTDSISRGIEVGAPVGGTAMLQLALAGVTDQVRQLASAPIKYGEGANTLQTSVQELQNSLGARATWARVTGGNEGLKSALSWVDKAPEAQAIKTNMLLLAFSVARAIDPGGRLSNKDVESVLMALGQAGSGVLTNREAMLRAMREVEDYTVMRVQDRYNQDRALYEKNNVILPQRRGQATQAQPAQTEAQTDPLEGRIAEDASGNRIVRRNGRWESAR